MGGSRSCCPELGPASPSPPTLQEPGPRAWTQTEVGPLSFQAWDCWAGWGLRPSQVAEAGEPRAPLSPSPPGGEQLGQLSPAPHAGPALPQQPPQEPEADGHEVHRYVPARGPPPPPCCPPAPPYRPLLGCHMPAALLSPGGQSRSGWGRWSHQPRTDYPSLPSRPPSGPRGACAPPRLPSLPQGASCMTTSPTSAFP